MNRCQRRRSNARVKLRVTRAVSCPVHAERHPLGVRRQGDARLVETKVGQTVAQQAHGKAVAVRSSPARFRRQSYGRHHSGMMCPDRVRLAMQLLGDITQGELSRMSDVSPTTISLFLNGKRTLRPALAVRLVEGLERAFVRKGSRLDTAFFADAADGRTVP